MYDGIGTCNDCGWKLFSGRRVVWESGALCWVSPGIYCAYCCAVGYIVQRSSCLGDDVGIAVGVAVGSCGLPLNPKMPHGVGAERDCASD